MRIFDQKFSDIILSNENKLTRISNHWVHMKIKAKFRKHWLYQTFEIIKIFFI